MITLDEALRKVLERLGVPTLRDRIPPVEVVSGNPKYYTKPPEEITK